MDNLKLLIVDDVEDNRLVLRAICRKMEGFEIREAKDGLEAVEITEQWHPHIILMDIMMPRMDGFEASKIIKERFPKTIIMAVTAVIDPHMEENMTAIGVSSYIRKPIDKDLIRFKLQSFATLLQSKEGECKKKLSKKDALNPFNSDIRNFKTIFDIVDAEAMMDFGVWILSRCENQMAISCGSVNTVIELFYELMRHGIRSSQHLSVIIEESFEEVFITMKFESSLSLNAKASVLLEEFGPDCVIWGNVACVRLPIYHEERHQAAKTVPPVHEAPVETKPQNLQDDSVPSAAEPTAFVESSAPKEVRVLESQEQQLLRQSFVHKTTAVEYIGEIGGDVLDEIRDLFSIEEEWTEKLNMIENEPKVEHLHAFADGVLGVYVHAINNLFEFTALAYALTALESSIKANSEKIAADPAILKKLLMLLEHLGHDLASWRGHIFEIRDAQDIHYLDSSFFSSCMQIEAIISDTQIVSDDDSEMEFF